MPKYVLSPTATTSSHSEQVNYRIPAIVQMNLQSLIEKFPNGLPAHQLISEYKKHHGVELNLTHLGYRCVVQLAISLKNIFHVTYNENNNYILSDMRQPPPDLDSLAMDLNWMQRELMQEYQVPSTKDNFLEMLRNMPRNFPRDTLDEHAIILKQVAPINEASGCLDIYIGQVYDPSKFWFYLGEQRADLNKLMDNMQCFYGEKAEGYKMRDCHVNVGLYCSALVCGEYHRVRIIKMCPEETNSVIVYCIDYGTVEAVEKRSLCYLHNKFSTLPAQIMRGRLGNVKPRRARSMWTFNAFDNFMSMIWNRKLRASLLLTDDEIYECVLFDEESKSINRKLVEAKHAVYNNEMQEEFSYADSEPIHPNIHLYPHFQDFEKGNIMPIGHIREMLLVGFKWHQVFKDLFRQRIRKPQPQPQQQVQPTPMSAPPSPQQAAPLPSPLSAPVPPPPLSASLLPPLSAPPPSPLSARQLLPLLARQPPPLLAPPPPPPVQSLDWAQTFANTCNVQEMEDRADKVIRVVIDAQYSLHLFIYDEKPHFIVDELKRVFCNYMDMALFRRRLVFKMVPKMFVQDGKCDRLIARLISLQLIEEDCSGVECLPLHALNAALMVVESPILIRHLPELVRAYDVGQDVWLN